MIQTRRAPHGSGASGGPALLAREAVRGWRAVTVPGPNLPAVGDEWRQPHGRQGDQ